MNRNHWLALAIALSALPQAAVAQTWKRGHGNGHDYVEMASRERGASLRIESGDRSELWLRYYPPRTWNGAEKVSVRAGNFTSAMEIDGGDGALLSNVSNNGIGITRNLVDAIKSSQSLVIEGPATARVPLGQRHFALPDARSVIGQLEKRCGK